MAGQWREIKRGATDGATSITVAMDVDFGWDDATFTRSGTTVKVKLGVRLRHADSYWVYNSIGGYYPNISNPGSTCRYAFKTGGSHYSSGSTWMYASAAPTPSNGYKNTTETFPWEATLTVPATTSTASVTMYYTWKSYDLTDNTYSGSRKSGTLNITGIPVATKPSGLSVSVSNLTRTSATLTGSYSSAGSYASVSSTSMEWGSSTSYGNTGTSLSGLSPNTTYYYRYTVTNNAGLSETKTGSFVTSGNAPTISSVSTTPTRTGCSFTISDSYDTNASFSSREIQYGTSTSYGSTTGNESISGLAANTTYYYRVKITDNWSRTSSWKTGSFITTGNVPSIGTVSNLPQVGFGEFNAAITYDTNASFSSIEVQYGTSTSYGSTSNSWRIPSSGSTLTHNTLYYYRFRVTDNFGRTSSWKTSSMTISGNAPVINGFTYSTYTSTRQITLVPDVTYDTNASFDSISGYYQLGSTYTDFNSTSFSVTRRNTNFNIAFKIKDNFGKQTSNYYYGTVKVLGYVPTINSVTTNEVKSKYAKFTLNCSFDEFSAFSSYSGTLKLLSSDGTTVVSETAISGTSQIVELDDTVLRPGKRYSMVIKVTNNQSQDSANYTVNFKTKGGFKYNGKMSDSARLNGKEVIGMKFNGVEII